MPWLLQMLGFGLLLIGAGIALWVSVWVLLILFGIGLVVALYSFARAWLVEKGILNPTPGVPSELQEGAQVTIVEGDFTRLEENKPKQD